MEEMWPSWIVHPQKSICSGICSGHERVLLVKRFTFNLVGYHPPYLRDLQLIKGTLRTMPHVQLRHGKFGVRYSKDLYHIPATTCSTELYFVGTNVGRPN